ncbi:MAG: bifunctional precorrin-2 dehydrogenase/sirohydrochlorin ferrochelatase [bacterium]|nr:bifunctional precorrin-2 dehydrogenase/sirohydrochlorin ferrochelatase [bacterium]
MNLYPIMINLESKPVVIIGGGGVAQRKALDLLKAGASVRVISPDFHEDFESLKTDYPDRLELFLRKYEPGDLKDAILAFSATNEPSANKEVYEEARDRNIFINAVDDPPHCSFYIPSFIKRGDLILSLSTSGSSPAMAARLRREISAYIPSNVEEQLAALNEARNLLKSDSAFTGLDSRERGKLLKGIVNDDILLEKTLAAFNNNSLKEFLLGLLS